MLCIVLGFIIGLSSIDYFEKKFSNRLGKVLQLIGCIIGFVCICYGVTGFNTPREPMEVVKTIDLHSITSPYSSSASGQECYLSIGPDNTYTYFITVESSFAEGNSKAYTSESLYIKDPVFIVEEEDCREPRLVVYKEKAIATIWTFALFCSKTTYVFYIPA